MIRATPFVLMLLVTAAAALHSQESLGAMVGKRVRVWAPTPIVGRLVNGDGDLVAVVRRGGDTVRVALVGALLGAATVGLGSCEKWQRIPLGAPRPTVQPLRNGVGIGLTLRL